MFKRHESIREWSVFDPRRWPQKVRKSRSCKFTRRRRRRRRVSFSPSRFYPRENGVVVTRRECAAGAAERKRRNAKCGRRMGKQRVTQPRELGVWKTGYAGGRREVYSERCGDGIRTRPGGIRVLHYTEIPESILARVNPGTRYRWRIEAGEVGERGSESTRRLRANDGIYDNLFRHGRLLACAGCRWPCAR